MYGLLLSQLTEGILIFYHPVMRGDIQDSTSTGLHEGKDSKNEKDLMGQEKVSDQREGTMTRT